MSKVSISRRDFIKILCLAGGGVLLSILAPGLFDGPSTVKRRVTSTNTNIPEETVFPPSTPTSTKTLAPTKTSTLTPTLTSECKPLGLTDEAKEFLASHEVSKGDSSRKVVLITYDDMNYHKNFTTILDAYKYFGVKTTFFLPGGYSRNGISLKNYTAEIERIVSEGHVFGCHGLIHNQDDLLTNSPSDQIRKDIEFWLNMVKEIIPGYQVKWFRFPFGDGNERTRKVFAEYGLQSVHWSLESGGVAKNTFANVVDKVSAGDIVLSHSPLYYDAFYAHSIIENLLSHGFSLESVETGLKPEDYLPSSLNPENCK
ncbi:MAG TPA: polysaccharide deacetylase family protein [Anaerolineaceae bacterium]